MTDLIQPKDFSVTDSNGKEWQFILSKFPAIQGREIISKYPISALPKLGDYAVNEETMLKLMAFVGVTTGEKVITLSTKALVNNHTGDWEVLTSVEMAMIEYNCSFFRDGRISTFLTGFVQNAMAKISEILMASSAPSSPVEKQP